VLPDWLRLSFGDSVSEAPWADSGVHCPVRVNDFVRFPDVVLVLAKYQRLAMSMLIESSPSTPEMIGGSKRQELSALCRNCGVRRLDLFGSAATGRFDQAASDMDFLVEFEPLEPVAYADAYFRLREGLQSLFGREVDLVTHASVTNPFFRDRIESERQTLFQNG
jgi:hypothetical protein